MKSELRKQILKIRSEIPVADRAEKNTCIQKKVLELPQLQAAHTVTIFVDYRHEVETRRLIQEFIALGKIVALPVADFETGTLSFIAVTSLDLLQKTDKGLWEPPAGSGKDIPIPDLDLIFVPGSAFDRDGYRIGYGGGFYDRLLASKTPDTKAIGLAFSEQVVDRIPREPHDRRLDGLVTDAETVWFI